MTEQLHHDALSDLISLEGWWFRASEIHGILTAFAAFNQQERLSSLLFAKEAPSALIKTTIDRLIEHIDQSLAAAELHFRLLLPENTAPAARAEALIEWIEGFLIGKQFLEPLSFDDECKSFLEDLTEIAKLDPALADNEENLRLLNDLEEHCRLGALMLYAHSHRPTTGKKRPVGEKK